MTDATISHGSRGSFDFNYDDDMGAINTDDAQV